MIPYDAFVRRNAGYVTPALQERVRGTRLLIAGCGIGSSFAEVAIRLGFRDLVLIDGDVVDEHNLNRQGYVAADVGRPKAEALGERLRAIAPEARIDARVELVSSDNAAALVGGVDLVFDTIDFLDLEGIVALHDACRQLDRPAVSSLAVGWGAACIYFPPDGTCSFRRMFGLPEQGPVQGASYVEHFAPLVERIADRLDPGVVAAVGQALTVMDDGRPCPAPQVAPGAAAVGMLAGSLVLRLLDGRPPRAAPELLLCDPLAALDGPGIDVIGAKADLRG